MKLKFFCTISLSTLLLCNAVQAHHGRAHDLAYSEENDHSDHHDSDVIPVKHDQKENHD